MIRSHRSARGCARPAGHSSQPAAPDSASTSPFTTLGPLPYSLARHCNPSPPPRDTCPFKCSESGVEAPLVLLTRRSPVLLPETLAVRSDSEPRQSSDDCCNCSARLAARRHPTRPQSAGTLRRPAHPLESPRAPPSRPWIQVPSFRVLVTLAHPARVPAHLRGKPSTSPSCAARRIATRTTHNTFTTPSPPNPPNAFFMEPDALPRHTSRRCIFLDLNDAACTPRFSCDRLASAPAETPPRASPSEPIDSAPSRTGDLRISSRSRAEGSLAAH